MRLKTRKPRGPIAAIALLIPVRQEKNLLARILSDSGGVNGSRWLDEHFGVANPDLTDLFLEVALFLALDDVDTILAATACAVSVDDVDGEPLWMMLVGPPSASKSETIRFVSRVADKRLSDITLAGILTKKGQTDATGLLPMLGDGCNAFVTISDLSSLLSRGSGSKVSGGQQGDIFSAFRDIYDGAYSRMMDRVHPEWAGRVTFLAATTPAIDKLAVHADALGPRWVYWRLRQLDPDQRKEMARVVAGRTNIGTHRAAVANKVVVLIQDARGRLPTTTVSDEVVEVVMAAAQLASYGRAAVPRDYRGQVDGAAYWEEPARLTHQLMKLARALTAMQIGDDAVRRIVRRAALSSMPADRLRALWALHPTEWRTTKHVAVPAHLHLNVARRALEDWEQTGIVEMRIKQIALAPQDDDEERAHDTRPREWRIAPIETDLVVTTFGPTWT